MENDKQELIVQPKDIEAQPVKNESSMIMTVIEKMALIPDINMSNIERMMKMYEDGLNRQAKIAFAADMAKLQADLPVIDENGMIAHNNKVICKYAKFEDINEAIKPHMKNHGFAISFRSNFKDSIMLITGILTHKMGYSEETTMQLPFDTSGAKNAVQAIGSSVSYGKRYVLCMLLNISTGGQDDDAKSEVQKPGSLDVGRVNRLRNALKVTSFTEQQVCDSYGVERFEELPLANFNPILNKLRKAAQNG